MEKRAQYLDLRKAIKETIGIVELQIGRIKQVYILLDDFYRPESCAGLLGILDEAFNRWGGR